MDPLTISAALSEFLSNPAILTALGSMAAGTAFKSQANRDVLNAQHGYTSAEMARQRALDAERNAKIAQTQPQFDAAAQAAQQQSIAQKMSAQLTPQTRPAVGQNEYEQNPGSPQEVQDRKQAVLDSSLAKGQDYARRLATLSSYNLLNFGNSATLNRLGENVGVLNSEAARSSQILPIELEAAKRAGMKNEQLADIANGVGSIATLYGASQLGKTPSIGGGATGTGITLPADTGYESPFGSSNNGLNVTKPYGTGLRVAGVPRLQF